MLYVCLPDLEKMQSPTGTYRPELGDTESAFGWLLGIFEVVAALYGVLLAAKSSQEPNHQAMIPAKLSLVSTSKRSAFLARSLSRPEGKGREGKRNKSACLPSKGQVAWLPRVSVVVFFPG